jgi:hypothetical protein
MLSTFSVLALAASVIASPAASHHAHGSDHDHHIEEHSHGEQMPLGYVKFPTQFSQPTFYKQGAGHENGAFIPGDGETTADAIFSGKSL